MKVNLKDLTKNKEYLKQLQSLIRNGEEIHNLKAFSSKLEKVIRLYEEVETDLELSGESIIELDMPRTDALEERNKMMKFINNQDDI